MSGAWPMSSFARESTLSSCTGRSVRSAFSTSRTARLSPRSSDATSAHRSNSHACVGTRWTWCCASSHEPIACRTTDVGALAHSRRGTVKTSIATVSISGDLHEKLAAIAAAGFDGVEIFETDFLAFDGTPEEVGSMVRDHGLEITMFQPFRDFEGLPEPQRERAFDRAEHKFDLMQQLGTDLMLVCSSVSPLSRGGIDRRSEEHTSELQSLMRISYAVF